MKMPGTGPMSDTSAFFQPATLKCLPVTAALRATKIAQGSARGGREGNTERGGISRKTPFVVAKRAFSAYNLRLCKSALKGLKHHGRDG